jgi:3-hexulose-6-phosphate synthase
MRNHPPLLQLALDVQKAGKALDIAQQAKEHVDVIEAGTLLLLSTGMEIVRRLREGFPARTLLADVKIMDAARPIAEMAFEAGADIVTVMAVAPHAVWDETMDTAQNRGKQVMLDLLGAELTEDLLDRISDVGIHMVCVHRPRGKANLDELFFDKTKMLLEKQLPFALAGQINADVIPIIQPLHPHIVIVGGAITKSNDPAIAAREIRRLLV